METPTMNPGISPKIDLENLGPDVRSYVYQTMLEFEPFTTPNTSITVTARDPSQLLAEDAFEDEAERQRLQRLWRIAITLSEDGTQIEEEGVHEDIYQAIRQAKDKMLKTLSEIQDQVVSNQDRMMQINNALAGHQLH